MLNLNQIVMDKGGYFCFFLEETNKKIMEIKNHKNY